MQMLPSSFRQSCWDKTKQPDGLEQVLLEVLLKGSGFNMSPLPFSSPRRRSWAYASRGAWFGAITFGSNKQSINQLHFLSLGLTGESTDNDWTNSGNAESE